MQKQAKKRSLCVINEHFEPVFNTVAATQIVFQRPVNAQAQSLQQAHPCSVQQTGNQPYGAIQLSQQRRNLARRQYHRQALGRFCFYYFFQLWQINIQYIPIQKQQGCFRLPLRGSSHIPLNCKMRQKCFYFRHSHLFRMPLAMKQNKAPRPIDVGIFGANGINYSLLFHGAIVGQSGYKKPLKLISIENFQCGR
jgi:hypothetical protein